ncbi:MAG: hypothetical protein JOZ27_08585 [Caulobacteraceae bacterium]|nr:hypothetical protein [Caulobacteraceae bacterium]
MARRAALWVTPLVILLTVAAIVLRHRGSTEPSLPRPDRMATQDGWVQPFKNPVIPAGSLRAQGLWNDPDVLKDDGRYVMYLTSSVAEPFKPPIVPFRAVSLDGINWRLNPKEPVVMPAGTPFVSVETPSVVKFHGAYHMFFTGVYPESRQGVMAVGHAQSADGIHWTVTPRPVISPTLDPRDWNGFLVSEPGAIVRNDEIFVYFCALRARPGGRPPQDQSIGLAKTSDGVTFGPAVKVLSQSALYPPEKGFAGYSTPQPFELDGRVHLLYDVILYQA